MFEKNVKKKLLNTLRSIQYGELFLKTPEGECLHFKGSLPGPSADLELYDWRVIVNLMIKGDVGFSEDYRDAYFTTKDLKNLLLLGLYNEKSLSTYMKGNFFYNVIARLGYFTKRNTIKQSKKNIYAHYDLGNAFYSLWLDESMTYSSALYKSEGETLSQGQYNKYQRILDSFSRLDGEILEIGCGWGGFMEQALCHGKYQIKGITLSKEQKKYAEKRLEKYRSDIEVALEDYRDQDKKYDMIVSIEMLEAVGKKYWPIYFKKIKRLLKENGKAIIQTIIIDDDLFKEYCRGSDVIRTHIFPGGMLPSMSSLKHNISKVGLSISNLHYFGLDYAKTLEQWLENFFSQEKALLNMGFDLSFQRMWKFYLCSCIAGFITKRINVVQIEVSHDQ
jgi:cyclopropane-fatty-acyl-phospholipid synthase